LLEPPILLANWPTIHWGVVVDNPRDVNALLCCGSESEEEEGKVNQVSDFEEAMNAAAFPRIGEIGKFALPFFLRHA
jgi:hypothetical protein